ncbi:DNA/RNA non-specific endonuclease [Microbaculum marinum]|uniref:Endonuclease n=1 Tax=Microbaculum marinum TaxID=1764581 RepID=A0AAW9REW3_9HYPH
MTVPPRDWRGRALWLVAGLGAALASTPGGAATDSCPKAPASVGDHGPQTCRQIWAEIGMPEYEDGIDQCITPICHLGFLTGHDDRRRSPAWVIERLTREMVTGPNKRPDIRFIPEQHAPEEARAQDRDYTGSGFDRGHQAASADFTVSPEMMEDTFVLSNAVPQQGIGFNRSVWRELESLTQQLAANRGTIYVITGTVPREKDAVVTMEADACGAEIAFPYPAKAAICEANAEDIEAECTGGVAVPIALYKIIYDPALNRVNAYLMPNINHTPLKKRVRTIDYIQDYRTSIATIENLTGLKFFPDMTRRQRSILVEGCGTTMLH